jgi:hypothetical protein
MAELIEGFDIGRFGSAPTKFDAPTSFPLTARYLQTLPLDAVADRHCATSACRTRRPVRSGRWRAKTSPRSTIWATGGRSAVTGPSL